MRNVIRSLGVSALILATGAMAQAVTYTDSNFHGVFLSEGQSAGGQFNITPAYNPAVEQINSASVTFTFLDDVLGDLLFVNWKLSVDGEAGTVSLNGEQIASESSNSLWFFASLTYGVPANIVLSLSNTGLLDYTISATDGDFYFKTASLTADASARQVPDGGVTLMLLGGALVGLAAFRRRFAN